MDVNEYDSIIRHLVAMMAKQDTINDNHVAHMARLDVAIEGIHETLVKITRMLELSDNGTH